MLATLISLGLPLLLKLLPFIVMISGAVGTVLAYGHNKKVQGQREVIDHVNKLDANAQKEIATDKARVDILNDAALDDQLRGQPANDHQ